MYTISVSSPIFLNTPPFQILTQNFIASADSYQYQLQSMWQKCWNTQTLVHNLRFRERGPLKSWRPETMAEAIFSVLKEGLSLSQAARKYDIPYPTFVLYANRVHNMLGPSADGGAGMLSLCTISKLGLLAKAPCSVTQTLILIIILK